jgi:membrane-bound lytic murein transglycosylase B
METIKLGSDEQNGEGAMRPSLLIAVFLGLAGTAQASAVSQSERPALRPAEADGRVEVASAAMVTPARSVRPVARTGLRAAPAAPVVQVSGEANARFDAWVEAFKRRANAQGISSRVLDQAFRGVQFQPDVVQRDRNQSEFTKTLWEYLDSAASDTRVSNGRDALRKHARVLDRIEAAYGVPKEVVVAVWGLESSYGSFRGKNDVIASLATLAFDGRRARFFEAELINALKILQNGDTAPRNMTGSWAGAMGHTQFMPSSFNAYAVDFSGDGRRDIWSDDPTDALASTANYLAKFGWRKGEPWGLEVQLPRGFDYAQTGERVRRSSAQWEAAGVRAMGGGGLPNSDRVSILVPAGSKGAAFAIYRNFNVIERYNPADAYVIGVGHLSDRIAGRPAIKAGWPRGDRALKFAERKEMQQLLTRKGFSTGGVDGKVGPNTLQAVRQFQASVGLVPDGYASLDLLTRLRR